MRGKRVAIVGVGNVGSSVAYSLAMSGSCHEVILRANDVNKAKGKALDLSQAAQAARKHTVISVAETLEDVKDCDVVVVTAGSPRLPGMSRDDLLLKNAQIMKDVINVIKVSSPNAVIIPVSNPLDAMVYVALKETGWDRSRVLGMAGILDSARMAHFVYAKLGYGAGQIRCSVMGGHGDDMVPLPRFSTVAGVPLTDLLTWDEINEIVEKTKKGGAEIVELLQDGSAYYAPAKSTALMVEAVLTDTKQIYPCAVMLKGEYGYTDVVSGVPVMIGAKGVEKVIEANLNDDQDRKFAKSVGSVQELIDALYTNKFYTK
ncbi:malate dehydrogenase [Sulfurimonas hongkongensis]|uniref:Malate dehydrogenase n=1 Tax=Sulfurimonas hongkongensis TaxID=1172190 RepID=T0JQ79_9BACT|nr:malate dehydrogenase [Sulfurimonas hongkongensis]EQB40286.1 malate dehydrogenase [Sulfurimonas hongkongensis]